MPGSTSGVQTFVNRELPVGVPGDYAGANIRASVVAGPWTWIASPAGVNIGAIGWCDPSTGIVSSYFKPNCPGALIHRTAAKTIITNFLGIATSQIPGGYEVTPMAQGDFLALFAAGATQNQSVYANPLTGALTGGSSGAGVTASNTSVTTTTGGAMTLVGTTTGTVAIGQIVVMAGLPAGTYIVSGSGTAWVIANLDGAAIPAITTTAASFYGVQQVTQYSVASAVPADPAFTGVLAPGTGLAGFSTLTASSVTGVIAPGQWLYSTGSVPLALSANVKIISQLSGTVGGAGTYLVSGTYTVSSQSFNSTQGKIGKISSWS